MSNIGRIGEREFGKWCDAVYITANKTDVDERGWDFFLEFPDQLNSGMPRDMAPTPIECKVQVKSKVGSNKRKGRQVKLSNLERFVKAKILTFFCFIEFDNQHEAKAAYLVHVGKEIIERTLRKIRELNSEGITDDLHNHEMWIGYTKNDQLMETNGKCLKRAIEHYIPETVEKYIEEKIRLLNTLGFENGRGQFTFQITGRDPVNDLIDLSLGIREDVDIDRGFGNHLRFEIPIEDPSLTLQEAILSIKTKPELATLCFRKHAFAKEIVLPADLYLAQINRLLPKEYIKFRVKTSVCDIVIKPLDKEEAVDYSFNLGDKERHTLKDLKGHLEVLALFQETNHPLLVDIKDKNQEVIISLDFSMGSKADDWIYIYDIAEKASLVCQQFSVLEDNVLVSIDELINSSYNIELVCSVLHANLNDINFRVSSDSEECNQGDKFACISCATTTIGNYNVGCFWAIVGFLDLAKEKQYKFVAEDIFWGDKLVSFEDEVTYINDFKEKFDDFEDQLRNMGFETIRLMPTKKKCEEQ